MLFIGGFIVLALLGISFFNQLAALIAAGTITLSLFIYLILERREKNRQLLENTQEDLRYKVLEYEKTAIGRNWISSDSKNWYPFSRARKLVPSFVVVDLITTGTNPVLDEIVQIAAIKFVNGQEKEQFLALLKPTFPLPIEVQQAYPGLVKETKNATSLDSIWPSFLSFISQQGRQENLVGVDSVSLIRFIIATTKRLGLEAEKLRILDLIKHAKKQLSLEKEPESVFYQHIDYHQKTRDRLSNCKALAALYFSLLK